MSAINSRKQDSEEKYKKIFEESAEAIFIADAEAGIILECNRAATDLVDRTKDELIGQHQSILHPPEKTENGFTKSYKEHMHQLTTLKKDGARLDTQVITKNGKTKDVSIRANLMYIGGKKIIYASFRDITQQKQAEEALKNSEEQFRSLAENSPNMIFINQNGRIVYVNRECERVMGYSKEEFYSPDFEYLELFPPEFVDLIKEKSRKHLKGLDLGPYEYRLITKNGALIDALGDSRPITYNGSLALLGLATDITERKKNENKIITQSKQLEAIFASSPDAITVTDLSANILDCNQETLSLLGFSSKEEIIGKSSFQLISPKEHQNAYKILTRVLENGAVKDIELMFLTKEGKEVPVEFSVSIIKNSEGKPVGLVGILRNISERKNAQNEILLQKQKLTAIFACSPDAIFVTDLQGKVVDCNGRAEEMFLLPKKGLIGTTPLAVMDEIEAKKVNENMEQLLKAGKIAPKEHNFSRANGEKFAAEVTASILNDSAGNAAGFVVAFRDITERKNAEKLITLLSSVVQQSVEGIAVSDNQGKILFLNAAWKKMHKTEKIKKDLIGELITRFYDSDQLSCIGNSITDGAIFRGRLKQIADDGTNFTTLATLSPLRDKEGQIIGTIHTAKKLTEIVREIRAVGSHASGANSSGECV